MKKIFTAKKLMATAALLSAFALQGLADSFNNVWVRADVVPQNAGTVFVDWYIDEVNFASYSEFKRSINFGASNAFILTEPADGWLFAGVARDMNRSGQYEAETDKQIHVFYNGFFTAFYDHTEYTDPSSSSGAMLLAQEALAQMTQPTDQVLAVFTKGAVAHRAEGQEAFGYVYSSKLYNEPGDQVTFYAYGDYDTRGAYNVYYKFDCWKDAAGNEVSRDRELTVTVKGMETYYANFVTTTKADYQENEKVPEQFKFDYNNSDWNGEWNGIETVSAGGARSNHVYDLGGRRMGRDASTLRPGLYVVDGRKLIIRK